MRNHTLVAAAVSFLLLFTSMQLAAEPINQSRPIPLDALSGKRFDAPDDLRQQGIQSFAIVIAPPSLRLELFNDSQLMVAAVVINEHFSVGGAQRSVSYTIERAGLVENLVVELFSQETFVRCRITSAGKEKLTATINFPSKEPAPTTRPGVKGIESIEVSDKSGNKRAFRGDDIRTVGVFEDEVFDTENLLLLKMVVGNLGKMTKAAFQQVADKSTGSRSNVKPVLFFCTVNCYRISTLMPIYACDGGSVAGCRCSCSSGFWWIAGCGIDLTCTQDCSYFAPVFMPDCGDA